MDRREFVKGSLAFAGLVFARPVFSMAAEPQVRAKVFVEVGETVKAVRSLLVKAGGISRFVKKGDRVLLKPNFSFSNPPEAATTTNPELVREVVMTCKEAGARSIVVADHTIRAAKTCIERSGMQGAVDGIDDVRLVVPSKKQEFREIEVKQGKSLKKVELAKVYLDSDVYINMPVAKNHSAGTVSFALKNQMGLIYDRQAFHSEYDLHQAIADLATVMKPHLTILDATRCLKTNGPSGPGEVAELGRLACSTDLVALDAYATTLVEWGGRALRPADVGHIKAAFEHGLGEMDLAAIQIV